MSGGRSYSECKTCVNRQFDPFECQKCVAGSKWQGDDEDIEWMTLNEFKDFLIKEEDQ